MEKSLEQIQQNKEPSPYNKNSPYFKQFYPDLYSVPQEFPEQNELQQATQDKTEIFNQILVLLQDQNDDRQQDIIFILQNQPDQFFLKNFDSITLPGLKVMPMSFHFVFYEAFKICEPLNNMDCLSFSIVSDIFESTEFLLRDAKITHKFELNRQFKRINGEISDYYMEIKRAFAVAMHFADTELSKRFNRIKQLLFLRAYQNHNEKKVKQQQYNIQFWSDYFKNQPAVVRNIVNFAAYPIFDPKTKSQMDMMSFIDVDLKKKQRMLLQQNQIGLEREVYSKFLEQDYAKRVIEEYGEEAGIFGRIGAYIKEEGLLEDGSKRNYPKLDQFL